MALPEVIERRESTSLALLDPQALIAKAIETGAGIETMERLVALAAQVREIQAKEAFYAAMAEFQRLCPPIKKTASAKIQTRGGGNYSYKFAPLDEITSVISPSMGPLGLSFSWRSRIEPDKVIVVCRVTHQLGHYEESGDIPMPVEKGDGTGANAMQRVGIALTYAKRYSLLGIIGKAPEADDDGQAAAAGGQPQQQERAGEGHEGDGDARPITEPQQKRFYAIARGVKPPWTDEQIHDLLAARQIAHVAEISMAAYDGIIEALKAGPKK